MKLLCKNCGAPVPARNVNVQTMTAVCENCDSVFTFDASELAGEGKRRKLKRPEAFDVQEDADGLYIDIAWRRNRGPLEYFLLAVFVGLGSVTGLAASAALSELAQGFSRGALVGSIMMIGAALFFTYMVVMFLINHTEIRADSDRVTARHYPLFWPGASVAVEDIDHIETEPIDNIPNYHYLRIVEPNSTRHTIDNYQVAQAQYLKHRLERYLFAAPEPLAPDTARLEQADDIIISDEGELLLPGDDEAAAHDRYDEVT